MNLIIIAIIACMDLGTDVVNKLSNEPKPCQNEKDQYDRARVNEGAGSPTYAIYEKCQEEAYRRMDEQRRLVLKNKPKLRLAVSAHICADMKTLKEAMDARAKLPKWSKNLQADNLDLYMILHDAESRLFDAKQDLKYAQIDQRRRGVTLLPCSYPSVIPIIDCFREIHVTGPLTENCRKPEMLELFNIFEPN